MNVIERVKLPDYLIKHVRELAEREGVSVEQFIASAVAEKASAWTTIDYLKKRGEKGSREKFLAALENVPSIEPDELDRLD